MSVMTELLIPGLCRVQNSLRKILLVADHGRVIIALAISMATLQLRR